MVTFYAEAITPSCQEGLDFLRQHRFIQDFYLAGGTALALQIGHRISTDLDWFSQSQTLQTPERDQIRELLATRDDFEVVSEQDGMLFTRLFGTDVSFIHQHHPLLEPTVEYQGVQLAAPTDIGLMKLAAINARGTRRDFVDIFCLRETVELDRLLELVAVKFSDRPNFLAVTARALAYFEDAEQQPMPRMLVPVQWQEVRTYCEDTAQRLGRRLSGLA
jgi:predicted nucleotidyltransferase component of viral defense system